jgi:hypothetical protein
MINWEWYRSNLKIKKLLFRLVKKEKEEIGGGDDGYNRDREME